MDRHIKRAIDTLKGEFDDVCVYLHDESKEDGNILCYEDCQNGDFLLNVIIRGIDCIHESGEVTTAEILNTVITYLIDNGYIDTFDLSKIINNQTEHLYDTKVN